jgi:hypothetical protein
MMSDENLADLLGPLDNQASIQGVINQGGNKSGNQDRSVGEGTRGGEKQSRLADGQASSCRNGVGR